MTTTCLPTIWCLRKARVAGCVFFFLLPLSVFSLLSFMSYHPSPMIGLTSSAPVLCKWLGVACRDVATCRCDKTSATHASSLPPSFLSLLQRQHHHHPPPLLCLSVSLRPQGQHRGTRPKQSDPPLLIRREGRRRGRRRRSSSSSLDRQPAISSYLGNSPS